MRTELSHKGGLDFRRGPLVRDSFSNPWGIPRSEWGIVILSFCMNCESVVQHKQSPRHT